MTTDFIFHTTKDYCTKGLRAPISVASNIVRTKTPPPDTADNGRTNVIREMFWEKSTPLACLQRIDFLCCIGILSFAGQIENRKWAPRATKIYVQWRAWFDTVWLPMVLCDDHSHILRFFSDEISFFRNFSRTIFLVRDNSFHHFHASCLQCIFHQKWTAKSNFFQLSELRAQDTCIPYCSSCPSLVQPWM